MKYAAWVGRVHTLMNLPVQYERNRIIIPDSGIEDEALPTNQNKAILTGAGCSCLYDGEEAVYGVTFFGSWANSPC
jgi:hypothetical protein